MYYVYLLRCAGGTLYTGITTDPARRFAQHAGRLPGGAKYTASHPPERMEAVWRTSGRNEAARIEARIKALPRTKKEALLQSGDAALLTGCIRVSAAADGTLTECSTQVSNGSDET